MEYCSCPRTGVVPIIKRKQAYVARNPKSTVRKTKFQYNFDAFTNQSPLWDPKVVLFIHSVETWGLCGRVLDWNGPENNLSGKFYQIVLAYLISIIDVQMSDIYIYIYIDILC